MPRTNLWKAVLILVILGLCVLAMYPPQRKLKPGLDLAGGTTLVYEVQVQPGLDARATIEQVIEVLRARVDPNGVRGLIWRPQSGNRIEISMALPDKASVLKRQTYIEAQRALLAANLSRQSLDTLLRSDAAGRQKQIASLSKNDDVRAKALTQLVTAHDALTAARAPYEEAQAELRAAEAALEKLPAEPAAAKTAMQAKLASLQKDLTAKTRTFIDARKSFQAVEAALLATNIEPIELDKLVTFTNKLDIAAAKDGATKSPRLEALDRLIAAHPGRDADLKAFVTSYNEYEAVKGPLDDANDLITQLRGSGVLEFRIAASPADAANVQSYRDQLREKGPRGGIDRPLRWFPIDKVEAFAEKRADQEVLRAQPEVYFERLGKVGQEFGGQYYLLLGNSPSDSLTRAQQGWKLDAANRTIDGYGFPAVSFQLNNVGGELMGSLTGNHKEQPMAILLDGKVMSAPNIKDRITTNGIINGGRGGFSEKELSYLVRTLNAGSLQASLGHDPISIQTTGPQFGQDNLNAGLRAVVWSIVIVSIFMCCYYFFFGLIADAAMLANIVLVLGVMAMLDATFTLPGIAGLVLTVGMAVDANVLVYERIREELERQAPLRTAVRLGFQKAWSTIIDAHVTALITCVVLGYTATADIKGFAVTLGIGLLANLFTGVFCTRVAMELAIDSMNLKHGNMLPMKSKTVRKLLSPKIDWIGKRWLFLGLSWVVALVGLASVVHRGSDFLDIEFRSGTQVSFQLAQDKTLSLEDVRKRLSQVATNSGLEAMKDASAVTVGEAVDGKYRAFTIATIITDVPKVSAAIKDAFGDALDAQRPIAFKGIESATPQRAALFPVKTANLGAELGRTEINTEVSDYVGGVAIVLSDLAPAPTTQELTERISRMRLQAAYESLGLRQFTVVGLDPAPADAAPSSSAPGVRYRSVAVVSTDTQTNYAENPTAIVETGGLADTEWSLIRDAFQRDTSLGSVSKFDSQFSATMKQQAIVATIASCVAILLYIWFRFGSFRYGLAAIIATMHDFVIAIGLIGLSFYLYEVPFIREYLLIEPFRMNLAQVAALLTLIGYSLNDTVVVFDRIRENRGRLAVETPAIINDSINQTISRTLLTSVTTFIAVFILYVVGGSGVRGFAFTMLIGVVVGTYSSIAIAAPLLIIGRKEKPASSSTMSAVAAR
jgi:SecD/SecF fusion protein